MNRIRPQSYKEASQGHKEAEKETVASDVGMAEKEDAKGMPQESLDAEILLATEVQSIHSQFSSSCSSSSSVDMAAYNVLGQRLKVPTFSLVYKKG